MKTAMLALMLGVSTALAAETAPAKQKEFSSPDEAARALIAAATAFDVPALTEILGPDSVDLVVTDDMVQSKNNAKAFAEQANTKKRIERDPKHPKTAILSVGMEDWPMPIPIVQGTGGQWRFDTKAGREEILLRRIGRNELDAIAVCQGYVEAQGEYASEKHAGSMINQYAQRMIATPGKQDGLAWRNASGEWEGPVSEVVARAIAEGYTNKEQPFHGYYYKVLKGQGPNAPFGAINYVVKGVMIGGFALVAAPADYRVSGIMTFIVNQDGVVYEKDLGEKTLDEFKAMTLFDPDKSWKPVETR